MRPNVVRALGLCGVLAPLAVAAPAEAIPLDSVLRDVQNYVAPILGDLVGGGGDDAAAQQETLEISVERSSDPFTNLIDHLFGTNSAVIANYGWSEGDLLGRLGIIDPGLLDEETVEDQQTAFELLRYQNLVAISDSVLGFQGQDRLTNQQAYLASYSATAYSAAEQTFTPATSTPTLSVLQPLFESSVSVASSSHSRTATQDVLKDIATQGAWRDNILTSGMGNLGDKLDQIDLALHHYMPRAAQQRAATVNSLSTIGNQLLDLQLSSSAQLQVGSRQQQLEQAGHDADGLNRLANNRVGIQASQQLYFPGLFDEQEGQ